MGHHTHSCVWRLFSHLNCMKDSWHICISTSLNYIFDNTHSCVWWLLNHVTYMHDSQMYMRVRCIHLDISIHMHFNEMQVIFRKRATDHRALLLKMTYMHDSHIHLDISIHLHFNVFNTRISLDSLKYVWRNTRISLDSLKYVWRLFSHLACTKNPCHTYASRLH